MRTGRPKQSLELTVQERRDLTAVATSRSLPHGVVRRAQMILWTEDGMPVTEVARRMRLTPPAVGNWRRRFRELRLEGLHDQLKPGRPRSIDEERIDELRQLVNVVRGELSLVGPRPLLPKYLERYTQEERRRHDVVPGMTGWAIVHGRNAVDWDDRLARDVWYVDHWSLLLDAKILALTVRIVLAREGIKQAGHATMPNLPPLPVRQAKWAAAKRDSQVPS